MRKIPKTVVVVAVPILSVIFILLGLGLLLYFSPDPHEMSAYRRTEYSKEFRKFGLADVPKGARYSSGKYAEGGYTSWGFTGDVSLVKRWLSNSSAIRTAEVRSKPGKQAFFIYMPQVNRVVLVIIATDEDISRVEVETVSLTTKKSGPDRRWYDGKDARTVLSELLDDNVLWVMYRKPS